MEESRSLISWSHHRCTISDENDFTVAFSNEIFRPLYLHDCGFGTAGL
jgi:hypothetical protein